MSVASRPPQTPVPTVRRELMRAVADISDVILDCADEAEATGFYPERGCARCTTPGSCA